MKKIIALILCFTSLQLLAQQNKFTVSGKIKGLDSKLMFLIIYDEVYPNGIRRDSIIVTNGSFTISSPIDKLQYASISPGIDRIVKKTSSGGYYPAKSSIIQLFLFPGAKVVISGKITDFADAYPTGDKTNNDFAKLNKAIYPLMNKSVNIAVKLAKKEITDTILIKKMKDTAALLDKQVVTIKEKFLQENSSSAAAAWLLSDMMIRSQVSNEAATAYFNNMNKEKLVGVPFYTDVAKRVEGISATAIGKTAPDINTLNTYDGSRFDLAALRGKYVVIDFWGTWCGPCIKGMPRMKEYLDKYKDKVEIVGVASESDNGERWKQFIGKNVKYQWHHVLSRSNEDYILKFNVAGFPTKIIVDPQGKILGRYVGEDDTIYNKLDELLK